MVLYASPFPHPALRAAHATAWLLLFPCYWFSDRLLATLLPTTRSEPRQRRQASRDRHRRDYDADGPFSEDNGRSSRPGWCFQAISVLLAFPVYLACTAASFPFAALGFLLWAPLQLARRPYSYARRVTAKAGQADHCPTGPTDCHPPGSCRSFAFATAHLSLLPDSLSHLVNLDDTQQRAREAGRRIRCGSTRPQIKIYIDSPTNTSVSASSWASLAVQNSPGTCRSSNASPASGCKRVAYVKGTTGESVNKDYGENVIGSEDNSKTAEHSEGDTASANGPLIPHGVSFVPESDSCSCESLTQPFRSTGPSVSPPEPQVCGSGSWTRFVYKPSVMKKSSVRKKKHADEPFDHEISAFFPANLDFVCLQGIFDRRAAEKLRQQLWPCFPHILYDVGACGFQPCGFKCFGSGLLLASRFPLLDAEFRCFPHARCADALASKGALLVKVMLGSNAFGQRQVGYITCTHLQAGAGNTALRCEQLGLLLRWQEDFRKATCPGPPIGPSGSLPGSHRDGPPPAKDLVFFDVICGDFNFDNCSLEDKLEQHHEIFRQYCDPCRQGPGEEKAWAVGTVLEQRSLHYDEVCSAEGLQRVLECEDARQRFLIFPKNKAVNRGTSSRAARRLDYLLYNEETSNDLRVEVEDYTFVTQLSGLTDHIAVGMRLLVSGLDDEL
uniref:sphingomyelin phosphodiesterase 3 n=1 Tax=Myxine glutinosa TaxID=7769 RepID=UPI00358EED2A